MTGTVERLVADRGYGFLKSDEDRQQYFMHRSDAPDFTTLEVGDRVAFDPVQTEKGLRAEHIVMVEPAVR